MARPTGVRNQDFEEKRSRLLEKLTDYVLRDDVELPSFRQLAIAADSSEPTLRHYFTDRSGVVTAILKHLNEISDWMREAMRQPGENIADALETYHDLVKRFRENTLFIQAHAFGIRECMSDPEVRKAYLQYIVEPSINAVAERLVKTRGGPRNYQTSRAAAVMLSASSIMLILHQELLDGDQHAPIDADWYLKFVRTWMKDGLEGNPDGLNQS